MKGIGIAIASATMAMDSLVDALMSLPPHNGPYIPRKWNQGQGFKQRAKKNRRK